MSLSHQLVIKRKNIPWQELDSQILVLSPFSKKAHELNETAAFLWKNLAGPIELSALLQKLCDSYDVDQADAYKDLTYILEKFKNEDLIEFN